jgi:hypothetical protein
MDALDVIIVWNGTRERAGLCSTLLGDCSRQSTLAAAIAPERCRVRAPQGRPAGFVAHRVPTAIRLRVVEAASGMSRQHGSHFAAQLAARFHLSISSIQRILRAQQEHAA